MVKVVRLPECHLRIYSHIEHFTLPRKLMKLPHSTKESKTLRQLRLKKDNQ